jgi:hemerythrin superfamily protein
VGRRSSTKRRFLHNGIVIALDNLTRVAKKINKTEFVQFAEKLKLHAKTEEEILYPTEIDWGISEAESAYMIV